MLQWSVTLYEKEEHNDNNFISKKDQLICSIYNYMNSKPLFKQPQL